MEEARAVERAPEQPRIEEPRVEAPRAEPRAERSAPPKPDPRAALAESGLVMVETDRSKAKPVQAEPEPLEPRGRPRRERPKPPSQDGTELQQVETKR